MRCDPAELHGAEPDFLVVGGGIQGAAIARELSLGGASVVLAERGDFATGTSSRSSRLVHGGVRYLEQGHIALVREALAERERLLRQVPHLVRPLPLLMPFFRDGASKSPWLMRLGLRAYSFLARRSTLPRPSYHKPDACKRLFSGLRVEGLRGGSLFWDARTEDLPLTLTVLEAAVAAGVCVSNYLELVDAQAGGVRLLDRASDREILLRPRTIVNAAGPRVDVVRERLGVDGEPLVRISRGSHLVLPAMDCETALGAFLPDGRIQFVVPRPDGTVVGTTEVEEASPGMSEPSVPEQDLDYMLEALAFLLERSPEREQVQFTYAGHRALPAAKGSAGGLNREAFLVREDSAAVPVHTVVGGKLTTHRSFGERCAQKLLGHAQPSASRQGFLPGGEGPQDPQDPLWWRWGARYRELRAQIERQPELGEPLFDDRPHLVVEAVYAMRLGVVCFSDLVFRRLHHSCGPSHDEEGLRRAHALYRRLRPEATTSFAEDLAALQREING